jgi:hypothetical protein
VPWGRCVFALCFLVTTSLVAACCCHCQPGRRLANIGYILAACGIQAFLFVLDSEEPRTPPSRTYTYRGRRRSPCVLLFSSFTSSCLRFSISRGFTVRTSSICQILSCLLGLLSPCSPVLWWPCMPLHHQHASS